MTDCDVGKIPIDGECKTREEIMSELNDSSSDIDEDKLNDSEEDPEIQEDLDKLDNQITQEGNVAMKKARELSNQSAGKRRKKRKTRRRRKSKKSRKSRRRKGKKSRKSRRRRRRRTRKKKGGTHNYQSVENSKKEMVLNAFKNKGGGLKERFNTWNINRQKKKDARIADKVRKKEARIADKVREDRNKQLLPHLRSSGPIY